MLALTSFIITPANEWQVLSYCSWYQNLGSSHTALLADDIILGTSLPHGTPLLGSRKTWLFLVQSSSPLFPGTPCFLLQIWRMPPLLPSDSFKNHAFFSPPRNPPFSNSITTGVTTENCFTLQQQQQPFSHHSEQRLFSHGSVQFNRSHRCRQILNLSFTSPKLLHRDVAWFDSKF